MPDLPARFLFVVNTVAGRERIDLSDHLRERFQARGHKVDFFSMSGREVPARLRRSLEGFLPDALVAVGGDGTVNLVAREAIRSGITLGIIPTGSANGMARELGIPLGINAVDTVLTGRMTTCDAVKINEDLLCLHLSDLGLNARLVKYFQEGKLRGMPGYAFATLKALRNRRRLRAMIETRDGFRETDAMMVLIANASKYGTGAVINPAGSPSDGYFEVVIVKKLGVPEVLKMFVTGKRFNPKRIELHHARAVTVETARPVHFQVDGEYIGKLDRIQAQILPGALRVFV